MGVDTKGVVATRCKDLQVIGILLSNCISWFVAEERRIAFPAGKGNFKERQEQFSTPSVEVTQNMSLLSLRFVLHGQSRDLKLFLTCDCDNTGIAENTLSMSLGCWGDSATLMQLALSSLSPLGATWFDLSDSDDIELAPLNEPRLTILDQVGLGFLSGYDFKDLVAAFDRGAFGPELVDFEEVFGLPREQFEKLNAISDFDARQKEFKLAGQQAIANLNLGYLEDYNQKKALLAEAKQAA